MRDRTRNLLILAGEAALLVAIIFACVYLVRLTAYAPGEAVAAPDLLATPASTQAPDLTATPIPTVEVPEPTATPSLTAEVTVPVAEATPKTAVSFEAPPIVEVTTLEELVAAVEDSSSYNIHVRGDILVPQEHNFLAIRGGKSLTIDKGSSLTVECPNFMLEGPFANLGKLKISGTGRLIVYSDSFLTEETIGDYTVEGGGEIGLGTGIIPAAKLNEYLASFYTHIFFPVGQSSVLVIDEDVIVPAGKSLWLNVYCSLTVPEGRTLTIYGSVQMFSTANLTNEGTIHGTVAVMNTTLPDD